MICPFCNGTMRQANKNPSEYFSLGSWLSRVSEYVPAEKRVNHLQINPYQTPTTG